MRLVPDRQINAAGSVPDSPKQKTRPLKGRVQSAVPPSFAVGNDGISMGHGGHKWRNHSMPGAVITVPFPASPTTRLGFRLAAPRSIPPLRRRRLTANPAL